MTEFTYTILSSVPREEILQYCQSLSQKSTQKETFIGTDWEIRTGEPRAKALGDFTIYHTPIIFTGVEASVLQQVELFRLKFLSAGG